MRACDTPFHQRVYYLLAYYAENTQRSFLLLRGVARVDLQRESARCVQQRIQRVYMNIYFLKKERKEGQHPVGAYILLLFGFQICFIFFLRSVLASISLAKAGVSTAPLSLLLISLAYLSTEDNVSEHACAHSLVCFQSGS